MAGVGPSMGAMGSLSERGRRGKEEGEGRGAAGVLLGAPWGCRRGLQWRGSGLLCCS
jgi:hypothetical protein